MSWVDIVVIALLVLFAGFGVLRGVQKSALSLAAFLVAFIVAFFLAKPVAEGLLNLDGVRSFVIGTEGFSLYAWLNSSLGTVTPSAYLEAHFYQPILDIIGEFPGYTAAFTVAEGQALYIAFLVFSLIVGVAIYLVARILLSIATMIIKTFIPKRKSALNRLGGFAVGAVRGFILAIIIAFLFSNIGGLTQVPFINTVQTEYESAVIANHVNDWSYAIRNKMYLPNGDMYARLVDQSGMTLSDEDAQPEGYVLVGQELDLYVDFINLNYNQTVVSVVDGEAKFADGYETKVYNPDDYSHTGFGNILKSIMEYNDAAAQKIKDGGLAGMETATLKTYLTIVQEKDDSVSDLIVKLIAELSNYELEIVNNSNLTDPALVEKANLSLWARYDRIVGLISSIKESYAALTTFGSLELDANPSVVTVTVHSA